MAKMSSGNESLICLISTKATGKTTNATTFWSETAKLPTVKIVTSTNWIATKLMTTSHTPRRRSGTVVDLRTPSSASGNATLLTFREEIGDSTAPRPYDLEPGLGKRLRRGARSSSKQA